MLLFYQNSFLATDEEGLANRRDAAEGLQSLIGRLVAGEPPFAVSGLSSAQLLDHLTANYLFVEAAGGAVRTCPPADAASDGRWLLIYRNNRWDLPKGMVEPGEDYAAAALREVAEETGLRNHSIIAPLTDTYHIYNTYGRWTAKRTHWFLMHSDEACPTLPQTDEGITHAVWLPTAERHAALARSYSMMQHLDQLLTATENQ